KNPSCDSLFNGLARIEVQGGTPPYDYLWSTSAMDTLNVIADLSQGSYLVNVTDEIDCYIEANFNLINSAPIIIQPTITNASTPGAADGSIILNVSGSEAPYSFAWEDFSLNKTNILSGLTAGTYRCLVSDAFGCASIINLTVN
ncbi:MAG: hypothetical protein HKO56_03140, partial [Bacteroidia bacterium]|nr:SprB repeat-containing protein [Bacteroidia bacterium]NNM15630.1 hypothetical protein [Bacteroidia bacterium]